MLVEWSAGGEFSARDNFRSAEQSSDKHRETSSAWFRVENRLDYYHKIPFKPFYHFAEFLRKIVKKMLLLNFAEREKIDFSSLCSMQTFL